MRTLASMALLAASAMIPACDEHSVPDLSGDYTCDLQPVTTTWCNDGEDRPHIVTSMNVTIEQSLPGSAMVLRGWSARMSGYVTVGGDVFAHAENVTCAPCDTPNEFELRFEARGTPGLLESVELVEYRHGDYPTPKERSFFGYAYDRETCRAVYHGTCTGSGR